MPCGIIGGIPNITNLSSGGDALTKDEFFTLASVYAEKANGEEIPYEKISVDATAFAKLNKDKVKGRNGEYSI